MSGSAYTPPYDATRQEPETENPQDQLILYSSLNVVAYVTESYDTPNVDVDVQLVTSDPKLADAVIHMLGPVTDRLTELSDRRTKLVRYVLDPNTNDCTTASVTYQSAVKPPVVKYVVGVGRMTPTTVQMVEMFLPCMVVDSLDDVKDLVDDVELLEDLASELPQGIHPAVMMAYPMEVDHLRCRLAASVNATACTYPKVLGSIVSQVGTDAGAAVRLPIFDGVDTGSIPETGVVIRGTVPEPDADEPPLPVESWNIVTSGRGIPYLLTEDDSLVENFCRLAVSQRGGTYAEARKLEKWDEFNPRWLVHMVVQQYEDASFVTGALSATRLSYAALKSHPRVNIAFKGPDWLHVTEPCEDFTAAIAMQRGAPGCWRRYVQPGSHALRLIMPLDDDDDDAEDRYDHGGDGDDSDEDVMIQPSLDRAVASSNRSSSAKRFGETSRSSSGRAASATAKSAKSKSASGKAARGGSRSRSKPKSKSKSKSKSRSADALVSLGGLALKGADTVKGMFACAEYLVDAVAIHNLMPFLATTGTAGASAAQAEDLYVVHAPASLSSRATGAKHFQIQKEVLRCYGGTVSIMGQAGLEDASSVGEVASEPVTPLQLTLSKRAPLDAETAKVVAAAQSLERSVSSKRQATQTFVPLNALADVVLEDNYKGPLSRIASALK